VVVLLLATVTGGGKIVMTDGMEEMAGGGNAEIEGIDAAIDEVEIPGMEFPVIGRLEARVLP